MKVGEAIRVIGKNTDASAPNFSHWLTLEPVVGACPYLLPLPTTRLTVFAILLSLTFPLPDIFSI